MRRRAPTRPSPFVAAARQLFARPGRLVVGALFASAAGYIALNALAFQTARHPAPLFADPAIVAAPQPVPVPAPIVAARPAPAPQASLPSGLTVDLGPAPLPPARGPAETATTSLAPPAPPPAPTLLEDGDPIGALIRENAAATTASVSLPEPDPRIMAVQEALVALGHGPMSVDGLVGPATRAGIEAFERSEGLPVTGELDLVTLRLLAVRSGVPID